MGNILRPEVTYTPESFVLRSCQNIGGYALQPTWGDGHGTGFYTYAALRAHCPCATCAAVRAAGGHPEPRTARA
jgi:DUF971 family protein